MEHIIFKDIQVCYNQYNQGGTKVLVLLHGYLESAEIFESFVSLFCEEVRLLVVDLPGHGKTPGLPEQNMELMSQAVHAVLQGEKITSCWIAGHSMGGYVALSFARQYPKMVAGLCLLHSHPGADSEEVKTKRIREIALVEQGRKALLAQANIPNAFATSRLADLSEPVEKATEIALTTPAEGIVACLRAMMNRPDMQEWLQIWEKPFLLIAGLMDNYINYQQLFDWLRLPQNATVLTLENSGHMGFLEEPHAVVKALESFMEIY